ncbi:MAG: adenylosuccinate synthetase, partial [Tangfeifania sp.]
VEHFPFELNDDVKPVYVELPGWETDLTKVRSQNEFPEQLNNYINFIEGKMKIPVSIASVGPNREQTIFLDQD